MFFNSFDSVEIATVKTNSQKDIYPKTCSFLPTVKQSNRILRIGGNIFKNHKANRFDQL